MKKTNLPGFQLHFWPTGSTGSVVGYEFPNSIPVLGPGMQPGANVFDKLKLVITFLTNLGVAEMLCSFRLVLRGKTGKVVPESLEFLKIFFV